jgi:hypothetical protein
LFGPLNQTFGQSLISKAKEMGPLWRLLLSIPMRSYLNSAAICHAPRTEGIPNAFYKEALVSLRNFVNTGGNVGDSPSLVKSAYRIFIAAMVNTPKSVSQSTTDKYRIWKKTQSESFLNSTSESFVANQPQHASHESFSNT